MLTILTHPYNFPSANVLRNSMQEILKEKIKINCGRIRTKDNIICSYGRSDNSSNALNLGTIIRVFSNKRHFSEFIKNSIFGDSILTPEYLYPAPNTMPEMEFPFMARDSLSMSGGRGIHIINSEEDFNKLSKIKGRRAFTKIYDVKFELRVHILGGEPVKVFKKLWVGEGDEPKFPIRVMHSGNYHFSLVSVEKYPKLSPLISSFNNVFGTNLFCALDIGWTEEKEYLLFEANSAPGLNELTANLYADYIIKEFKNGL